MITTTEGKTYRCPVGSIAFGNSQKYTFPVYLQAPASSGGETIINLEMGFLNIDNWDEGKTEAGRLEYSKRMQLLEDFIFQLEKELF